jgi:hypothetical protein
MTAPELIQTIEAVGGVLTLRGDRIRYELPADAAPMIEMLRQYRDEVLGVLREREQPEGKQSHPDPYAVALEKATHSEPPPMPIGVRLLRWAPDLPPVEIESWAVVNDVPQFIQATLGQLQAAMAGKNWLAGNRSARELVERLEQVGVKVEIEGNEMSKTNRNRGG